MTNNKSYYWRNFKGEIGSGQEIKEVTEDDINTIQELKKVAYEKMNGMRLVKYKKVYQFPKYLIPCDGWDFQRFPITIQETHKGFDTLNNMIESFFKFDEKDIEIHIYLHKILAIRYRINECKGRLGIIGLTNYPEQMFYCTFETAISVPTSSLSMLKEYADIIKITAQDVGLRISDTTNIFTPIFYQAIRQNSNSLNALDLDSLKNFIEKIKVLQERLPFPLYFPPIATSSTSLDI